MPRGVHRDELDPGDGEPVAVAQGVERRVAQLGLPEEVVRGVHPRDAAVARGEQCRLADVVPVPVRDQHSDDPTAAHRGVDGVGPVRGIDHDDLRVVTDQPRVVLVDRRPRRVRVAGGQHLLDSRAHAVETSGLSRQAAVVVPGSRVPGPPSISLSPWNDGRTSSRGCSAPSRWR